MSWLDSVQKIETVTLWESRRSRVFAPSYWDTMIETWPERTGIYHLTEALAKQDCDKDLEPVEHQVLKLTFADKVVYYHFGNPIFPRTDEKLKQKLGW